MFQQHLIPLLFLELTKESGLLCFLFFLLGIFSPDIYIACLRLHLIQACLQISPYQRSSPCLSYIKWHPHLAYLPAVPLVLVTACKLAQLTSFNRPNMINLRSCLFTVWRSNHLCKHRRFKIALTLSLFCYLRSASRILS